jgi:methylated-DNA-[protein]-cysteine S-methyltransferase
MNETSYTYYQSPIGLLKIGGTEHYISEISFVDDEKDISEPAAFNPLLNQCVEELIEYFNGQRQSFDIPVYQKGTEFQTRVWSELLNINYGKTISYLTLAKRLGDPNCIRAAAASNGKNHICIVVPCHRVVGSNQSLVGYVGGLKRKKWLLDLENKVAHGVQTLF